MKHLVFVTVYVGFFGAIAFAVYWTKSAWPLWAFLLMPGVRVTKDDDRPS